MFCCFVPAPPGLTQPADGAVVGLVAQGVCAGVAEAEVPAGQDQSIADVRETHHTLSAVVTDDVLCHLARRRHSSSLITTLCYTEWKQVMDSTYTQKEGTI